MSTNWRVEGQGSDLSSDIEDLVEAVLNNASNWSETDPARTDITWGNIADNNYGTYRINVVFLNNEEEVDTLGDASSEIRAFVAIEVYVQSATENSKPDQLGKIMRQIDKICALQSTNLGSGMRYMTRPRWSKPTPRNPQMSEWYVTGRVQVHYRMTKS